MTERRPRSDDASAGRTTVERSTAESSTADPPGAESPTADRSDAGSPTADRSTADRPSNSDPWDRRLRFAVGLFLVGILADVATTYAAIAFGPFVEGSPVGRALIDRYGLVRGMIATKLAGMVLIALPVAIAKRNRTVVLTVMFGGVGALSLLAAVHNLVRILGAM
ncbi:hypothetical protein [Halopenitus persicus]|uniref:DUF5658 domain-containing protein n=1 Tax=Halopenitus persicus TaxID=1048396 RepID=A0A1H3HEV4_9EURY|nr:hypothetical protein [Halopenitus persicus]SDY13755.1 hypothetical protein SAMN05216564_103240 [Halopenitus persicus]